MLRGRFQYLVAAQSLTQVIHLTDLTIATELSAVRKSYVMNNIIVKVYYVCWTKTIQ